MGKCCSLRGELAARGISLTPRCPPCYTENKALPGRIMPKNKEDVHPKLSVETFATLSACLCLSRCRLYREQAKHQRAKAVHFASCMR